MITPVQRPWKIVCGLLLGVLLLGVAASWIEGGELCAPANHPVALPANLAVEPVTFPSGSGATIHGWLVESQTNRAIVILQHGLRSDRTSLVERARFLSQAGYAVLLFDFQAHGESLGKIITFGYLEGRDSQAAVDFVKKRFPGKPIGIIGISMGAAAAVLPDPPLAVQALVLESMYPTVVEATKDRIEIRLGPLGRYLSPLLTYQINLRAGCTADDLRPLARVAKISTPKLFLAGTADRETKFTEAAEIFQAAAEPKIFIPFKGARHQDLCHLDPKLYQNLILDFLSKNLQ
jgi:alpha-beta hydrolase superfamily lysophospholipase